FTGQGMNHHEGDLYATADGGKTWRIVGDAAAVGFLSFQDPSHGYEANMPWYPAQLVTSTADGGKTWNEGTLPGSDVLLCASAPYFSPKAKSQGALEMNDSVGPAAVTIYTTDDGGKTWKASPATEKGLLSNFLDDARTVYLATTDEDHDGVV